MRLTFTECPGTHTNVLAHDSGPCQYFPLALVVARTEAKQMCFCLEGEIASAKFTSVAQCVCVFAVQYSIFNILQSGH